MKKHTYLRLFFLVAALVSMALAQFSFFSGSKFIFSSHIAGHITLLLIAAPFSVLAMRERPEAMGGLAFGLSRWLSAMPWLNWILGIGILWVWQVPAIFNALMTWDGPGFHRHLHLLSFLHSGSLLLAGILFCWPLAGPYQVPPAVRTRIPAISYHALGRHHPAGLHSLYSPPQDFMAASALPISHRDQLFAAGSPLDSRLASSTWAAPSTSCANGWAAELWIHHEFYRRSKRRPVRTARDQEQIPAGTGEYVPRSGAIIPHHSPQ